MRRGRIVFLGLDAADRELLLAWSAAGTLPVLAGLLARGVSGTTRNPPGLYTGAVWPSFHTGMQPGRHGRYFYRQLVPGTYRSAPVPANALGAETIWSLAGRAGLRTAVIDLPKAPMTTAPNVLQIQEWGVHDPSGPTATTPAGLAADLARRFGSDPVGPCDVYGCDAAETRRLRDALIARIARKTELVSRHLSQGGWDLFMAAFADAHCAGHQLWAVHDPTHPEHDPAVAAALGDPLRDVYAALDAAIGRVLEHVPADATAIVLASHGMGAHYDGTFLLDDVLRRLEGAGEGGHPPAAGRLQRAWHRMPAAVRTRLAPLADAVYDRLRTAGCAKRRAFVVPTNTNCAGIRLNVAGREPSGMIRPGPEYDAALAALAADLAAIVNVETGEPVVHETLRAHEVFPGTYAETFPDLLVRWNRTAPIRVVASPKIGTLAREYEGRRTGDHHNPGFFVATGPGLDAHRLARTVDVTDFAPTFARLLGIDAGAMDGTAIAELTGARA
jgi:predicted AlkP superfamily phosphohydrolase/phosphomutase